MDIIDDTKIVFIDIDGTLTNSDRQITEKTKQVIKKVVDKDIYVILCSGRPNNFTIEKSKIINASPITISNSGNLVYDYKNNKIIAINEIKKENLKEIFNYCNQQHIECVFNGILNCYQNKYSGKDHVKVNSIEDIDEPICQICVITHNFTDATNLKKFISQSKYFQFGFMSTTALNDVENADYYSFDVMYKNFGKGDGIKKLLEFLNIPVSETLCFGDYINDYSMFKACDITVAMGNGTEKLKQLADYIALTNDEDGVAVFLEENLL